ncbi:WxL domain-containing protein [Prescottella defluvii]|uniref:hypothetical protein n=1 Tax=Prescottella defluvii TaxID=1323361 RepID=UPI0004F26146|nr:hypothetical protein [Prescottella defluvii]
MRKKLIAAAGLAATIGLVAPAAIANAAGSDSQVVDFTVTAASGGGLSVSTGGSNSTLGLAAQNATATGTLTLFGVTDTRGVKAGWGADIALSDFVNQSDNAVTIPATNATYTPGNVAGLIWGGTATPPQSTIALSNDPTRVINRTNRTAGSTLEVATWTNINALTVTLPAGVPVGQYRATLTLSAA